MSVSLGGLTGQASFIDAELLINAGTVRIAAFQAVGPGYFKSPKLKHY